MHRLCPTAITTYRPCRRPLQVPSHLIVAIGLRTSHSSSPGGETVASGEVGRELTGTEEHVRLLTAVVEVAKYELDLAGGAPTVTAVWYTSSCNRQERKRHIERHNSTYCTWQI